MVPRTFEVIVCMGHVVQLFWQHETRQQHIADGDTPHKQVDDFPPLPVFGQDEDDADVGKEPHDHPSAYDDIIGYHHSHVSPPGI